MKAQKLYDCIKWEGVSQSGHIIYGIAKSKSDAKYIIKDFNKRNNKTKYKIIYYSMKKSGFENQQYFDDFFNLYPKKYRVLSHSEMAAIRVVKLSNESDAASYYSEIEAVDFYKALPSVKALVTDYKYYRLRDNLTY